MSYVRVTAAEEFHSPEARIPRFCVWLFAIAAIPISGGASLFALPIAEATLAREKRLAAEDAARRTVHFMPEVQSRLLDSIRRGKKSDSVSVRTITDGWGFVERKLSYDIETDQPFGPRDYLRSSEQEEED